MQAIPPTLQQSLSPVSTGSARRARSRRSARCSAAASRYGLLRDVAGIDEPPLRAALDRLADADLVRRRASPERDYRFKHALIQDAAYENLLKSRRQMLHHRVAEILRDRFAVTAAAEPEALAHHFTQAGHTDVAIEWWGKAGDQALRRSAFAEAISHLGKAIELSDKAGAAPRREAAAAASASQRLKLQTDYGQAVMWSKGFIAEETKAAIERVGELAAEIANVEAPFDAYFARWSYSFFRGELGSARETAESFLRAAEHAARPTEATAAHRILGVTLLYQGDFEGGRARLEHTLRIYDPERDREAKFRFGPDPKLAAIPNLGVSAWCLGDVRRARELMDEARSGAVESAHAPTLALTYHLQALLEILRDDAEAARRAAETLVALCREHGLASYLIWAALPLAWARAKLGDRGAGAAEFRQALADYTSGGNRLFLPFYQGLLAEIEADGGDAEAALAGVDGALTLAGETGEHWFDAALHRIRGEILVKQIPPTPPPPKPPSSPPSPSRKSKRPAASSCTPRCRWPSSTSPSAARSTPTTFSGRRWQGFSPTPEFPQIAEAKALFEALAGDETVRAEAARRAQRLKLHTDYGRAVLWGKGFGAEETKAAFARVEELATEIGDAETPLDAYFARWVSSLSRGELGSARETAESFLREAERAARQTEAAVAHRILGLTSPDPRRFRSSVGALRTDLANIRPRARPRSQVPPRFGPSSPGDRLSGSRGLVHRRIRTRTGAGRRSGGARGRIRSCPDARQHALLLGLARNPP